MLKEHLLPSKFENFIKAWTINDCSICDEIIDYFHQNEKTEGGLMTSLGHVEVNKEYKDSVDCSFDASTDLGKRFIGEQLRSVTDEYVKSFPVVNDYSRWGVVEPVHIKFYQPGAGYHAFHTERSSATYPINNRHLVFMTYLNDVTDRGETEFLHQGIKIKPQKGLTVVWPADWTYTHRGITSLTQNKYIITGWYSFF